MKKNKNDFLYIMKYYKKYKILMLLTFVLSLTFTGLSLLIPYLEGSIISLFNINIDLDINNIIKFSLILMLVAIFKQLITHLWSCVVLNLNAKVNFDIKKDLLKNVMELKQSNFDKNGPGSFITRITKDSYELSEAFDCITDNIAEILVNIGFVIYAMIINIWLGIFILFYLIIILLLTSIQVKKFKINNNIFKQSEDTIMNSYNNLFKGIKDVRNLGLEKNLSPKLHNEQIDCIKKDKKTIHSKRSYSRIINGIIGILNFVFILLSLYLIHINQLTVANFIIIFLYFKNLASLIEEIIDLRENFAKGHVSSQRVRELLEFTNFDKSIYGKLTPNSIRGNIEFNNVKFSYNENTLFDNLSFSIKENTMVAFVGKSGEGKSTILDLISKNYYHNEGDIKINNTDIREFSKNFFDNNISVVLQEPFIFNATIKDNLKLANPNASDNDIKDVLIKADLYDFIMSKPNKLDTIVGENGSILSGGQKQRLAIARALIKKSKIILFDEATSALDNQSQDKIKTILKDLSVNHTIIIVAHRLSTIVDADEIFVLNDHKIIAKGKHKQLFKSCEVYKSLYNIEN